jgi:hypothetical protein
MRGTKAVIASEDLDEREPHGFNEEVAGADVAEHFERGSP